MLQLRMICLIPPQRSIGLRVN